MFEIHFTNNLSKHFVNVRTVFGTSLYKGTTPNLGQSLKIEKYIIDRPHCINLVFLRKIRPLPRLNSLADQIWAKACKRIGKMHCYHHLVRGCEGLATALFFSMYASTLVSSIYRLDDQLNQNCFESTNFQRAK
jgi:hypothetical protein